MNKKSIIHIHIALSRAVGFAWYERSETQYEIMTRNVDRKKCQSCVTLFLRWVTQIDKNCFIFEKFWFLSFGKIIFIGCFIAFWIKDRPNLLLCAEMPVSHEQTKEQTRCLIGMQFSVSSKWHWHRFFRCLEKVASRRRKTNQAHWT